MKPSGEGRLHSLIIGEAPGGEEDQVGQGFAKQGKAGHKLRSELAKHGIDLDKDFIKYNAVNCRPVVSKGKTISNRAPTSREILFCKPIVEQVIADLKPKNIWLLGGVPVEQLLPKLTDSTGISTYRGFSIPDRRYQANIFPLFHPSYIIRSEQDENLQALYSRDIANAVQLLKYPEVSTEIDFELRSVFVLTEFDEVRALLDSFLTNPPETISFDYETTGIKPYIPGHRIASIALCDDQGQSYAFPYQYRNHWNEGQFRHIKRMVRKIFTLPSVKKIAHNAKFESVWTSELVGVDVANWYWCTMVAAHILDNRPGITGLKSQVYLNFGVPPYGDHLDKFLKASGRSPFNKVDDAPLLDLLVYNALDALFTHKLQKVQYSGILNRGNLKNAFDFFHKGWQLFATLERRGICTDEDYYQKMSNEVGTGELDKKIQVLDREIAAAPEAHLFFVKHNRHMDFNSSNDLTELIYKILKYPEDRTEKNTLKTDETVLDDLKELVFKQVVQRRKLDKLRGTYLAQFARESVAGIMHPHFNLNFVTTYRSSSSDPNFQNIPKRDLYAKLTCRRGIKPRPGNVLLCSDFGGIEVGVSCCYHKDPNLIAYYSDPTKDMHRDSAIDLFLLPPEEMTKEIRHVGKNGWVFPEFYGSYYVNCAKGIWKMIHEMKIKSGWPLKKYLNDKGIRSYEAFEFHCKGVEEKFWGQRFKVYKKWKDEINALYREQGYIESYLGFIFGGLIGRNECTNYQTQGTAFHLLLWTMIEVEIIARLERWMTIFIGQIHDEMINDTKPSELDHVVQTINHVGTVAIRKQFPWIIVPLKIEHSVSEINGNWAELKEYREGMYAA
jgi:uracil-DNA glycosylase family 4